MIGIRLMMLFPLVLILVLLHTLPLLPRRSRLFGVEVPREVRYGKEGRGLLRSYQLRLLPISILALLAAWWVPPTWLWLTLTSPTMAALWILYRCHAEAVRFALPAPSAREASLSGDADGLARRLLWFAPPLALVAAAALYLYLNWSRIPERFASHFDSHGNPNGWAFKSVRGCFGPLALGAAIILFCMALYIVMELGSRRGAQRPVMLACLAAPGYLVGPMFAIVGLLPMFVPPLWAIVLLIGAYFPGLIVLVFRLVSRAADSPAEVTSDGCWHGSFYYNPQDPAIFVEGRTGFGLAANFARRTVWLLLVLIALVAAGLLLLGSRVLMGAPAPDWQSPAYSKPGAFSERATTVGTGDWKLPGTLSVPKSPTPVPGVVLVQGSGPEDRDETIFGNKPFKDLAEGLASKGIAVLRYEKRTKEYGAKMAAMRNFTVQDETVEDAVTAGVQLRAEPGVDRKRVFLLGHSLGGYLMPMMLAQAPEAAGGIVLAGTARPLEDVMLDQFEYARTLPGGDTPEARKQIDELCNQLLSVKALQAGHEDGPAILGAWPHYWLDLRGYDPVAQATKIARPLLILQGERDYQVTMKEFAIWKVTLAGRANVTLKSYPALNHLFVEGRGKSMPAEYLTPGHVSGEAISDIAGWVLTH